MSTDGQTNPKRSELRADIEAILAEGTLETTETLARATTRAAAVLDAQVNGLARRRVDDDRTVVLDVLGTGLKRLACRHGCGQ